MSASGKKVKKGEVIHDRAPEIRAEEIILGEKIGSGCFGSVYRGKCRGFNVAIKQLLKQNLEQKTLEDFRKEVDIMTQMRHPNVVLFMGACTEPGKLAICCELMKESVYDLLRKHNKDITLQQRVKMAKDTAAGMAWLHGASPQIIHRDLKPQNLLVDEHWNVKVCDFGLSQVKLREEKIRDGKSIPGTPLWMAPEVLLGKEVDEKADVYSFGIVLWEIVTGQEPFPHHDSYGTFKRAITKENERPPIPPDTHPSLKNLMERCWHPDTSKRPPFTEILLILDSVLLDCLFDDPIANKFWRDNFLGFDHILWTDFANKFAALLKIQHNPKELNFLCLKKILATPNKEPNPKEPDVVTLEKFSHIISWFGPIVLDHKGFTILDKLRILMQKDWFHGDIDKQRSEDLLSGQSKGTFLVRTSTTSRNAPFTISKVSKKGKINHQRINKRPDGLFELQIVYQSTGKTKTEVSKDDSLITFIKQIGDELYLEHPCPGSVYKALFLSTKVEGYLATDED